MKPEINKIGEAVTQAELLRAEQFASEQLLVALIYAACEQAPDPHAYYRSVRATYERLANAFQIGGRASDTKVRLLSEYMIDHGLKLLGQIRPELSTILANRQGA